jgi:hypothetical protein
LIVEWPGADRGSLEHQFRTGVVAVRYEGCALEVLHACRVDGRYTYAGFNRKRDTVVIQNIDELYTLMPSGAPRLESTLVRGQELHVDMTLVGMYTAGRTSFTRDQLAGQCDAATHVVAAAQVGAFSFYSGAAMAFGENVGSREVINTDGDQARCDAATSTDSAPPEGCGGLLRLELVPLSAATEPVAVEVPRARAAKRDAGARSRDPKKHRWDHAAAASAASFWIGSMLFLGGIVSGGFYIAYKGRANNLAWEMKEHKSGSATWQELAERRRPYEMRAKVSGWTGIGAWLLGGPLIVIGSTTGSGGLVRAGVTPIVQRTYGGLSLTFQF